MSSDSDLDFESADEDAEFSMKYSNVEPSKQVEVKKCDASIVKHEAYYEKPVSNDNSDLQSDDGKEIKNVKPTTSRNDKLDEENNQTQKKEKVESFSTNSKEVVSVGKNLSEEKSSSPSQKDVRPGHLSDVVTEVKYPEGEISKEKQRVVLRLEKKKQQKQLSMESPVAKEKPEDLINILEDTSKQQSSWGFGGWGTSLLSTAASSVSTFSTQVSQGIGTVLESVENTLGAPSPEELAHTLNKKKESNKESSNDEEKGDSASSMLPDLSSWTKVLENTGTKVISGGLNTLEFIGKKTIDILTEGDPGLRKKRSAFSNTANLSELLKEIKARAEEQDSEADSPQGVVHYSQVFDEKQGVVHLEALEMLSKQSQAKFQRLLLRHSKDSGIKKRLEEIRVICEDIPSLDDPSECESFEDFEAVFKKHSLELNLPLNVEGITKVQKNIDDTIKKFSNKLEGTCASPNEVYQSGICSLAEFTAKCIETFHKVSELILVQASVDTDLEHCATNLTGLTTVMCIEVNNMSSKYHKCLEELSDADNVQSEITTWATNLYLEGANSINYIQDAYQMLIPVLQVRLLETID